MSYFTIGIIVLVLLTLVSAGWYWLFKRFERRMSLRFDDLVERATTLPELFGDVLDYHHRYYKELDYAFTTQNDVLARHEAILLGIKHDLFLEYLKRRAEEARENGDLAPDDLDRFSELLESFKLDNYART